MNIIERREYVAFYTEAYAWYFDCKPDKDFINNVVRDVHLKAHPEPRWAIAYRHRDIVPNPR